MTDARAALVERVRMRLPDGPSVREVSMFGGRSVMVDDRMVVSALRDGDLLVRVAARRHDELLEIDGASPAEMGAGRVMGPGWIAVAAASIASDERLSFWIDVAMEHHAEAQQDGR